MIGMTTYYRLENRRRDKVEGGRPQPGTQLETVKQFDLAPGKITSHLDRVSLMISGFRYVP